MEKPEVGDLTPAIPLVLHQHFIGFPPGEAQE